MIVSQLRIAGWADGHRELDNWRILALSLERFGGELAGLQIDLYHDRSLSEAFDSMELPPSIHGCLINVPDEQHYFYSSKVFAAAAAEARACDTSDLLVWLDDDTVILRQPAAWRLPDEINLAFRPVMHRNIGLGANEEPNALWGRALELACITEGELVPLATPAFGEIVRGYINAGCLIVRPQAGTFRRWAELWQLFRKDELFHRLSKPEPRLRVFLHQIALACAAAPMLSAGRARLLPETYNKPLFFQAMFGASQPCDDISGWVSLRHENALRGGLPDAAQRLKGPEARRNWLLEQSWS